MGRVEAEATRPGPVSEDDDNEEDDDDFEPSSESGEVTDISEGDNVSFEDEDVLHSDIAAVLDNYEPNTGDSWYDDWDDEDCNKYFARCFTNAHVFIDSEFGKIQLKAWLLFTDKQHFKGVLRDYYIQEGFCVVVVKSDAGRYSAECGAEGCSWRIHASKLPDGITWAIKLLNSEHCCTGLENHNPMATVKWCAYKLMDDLRINPDTPIKALNEMLFERYGVTLKKSSAYVMKDFALQLLLGGHDISYSKLPTYYEVLKESNPGSITHCAWKPMKNPERTLQFKYIYISFAAEFMGLIRGCRGLIGVDGTHLKGNYKGVLLSAVALDGNNELFPIAHAIVEVENKDIWSNFFWHLKQTLRESGRDDWTIISDRQKGVEPALEDIWPEVDRRYCARHLCNNFKKSFPDPLMHKLFWMVCNAYSNFAFQKAFERLRRDGGVGTLQFFHELGDQKKWARHKFKPSLCSDENTSSFVESFNALLGVDRCRPVLTLLEGIRRVTMVRNAIRKEVASDWDDNDICPKVAILVKKQAKDAKKYKLFQSSDTEFEIQDGTSFLPVNLEDRTCTCGQWQISGIPYRHALRAINHLKHRSQGYVSEWFSVKKYKAAYSMNIHPVADDSKWPKYDHLPHIEPPPLKRGIGRPPRNRRREEGEKRKGQRSTTVKCKRCKPFGHNSRTCKGGPTAKEIKEGEGLRVEIRQKQKKHKGISASQPISMPNTEPVSYQSLISTSQPTRNNNIKGTKAQASKTGGKRKICG